MKGHRSAAIWRAGLVGARVYGHHQHGAVADAKPGMVIETTDCDDEGI